MKLYGLKNCDTCRKALKALPKAELIDVSVTPVPQAVLERGLAQFGDKMVNTRSTTWRSLSDSERNMPAVDQLRAHPKLMKRPLIERDGTLYLGWDASVQAALAD